MVPSREIEQEIVQNVFQLGDRRITSLMTNRQEIVYLDLEESAEENIEKVIQYKHSTYPLCNGGVDEVVGLVYSKDLLGKDLSTEILRLDSIKREVLYIPENNRAYQVLERFRERRQYVGIIVDEYGGVLGIVTLNDNSGRAGGAIFRKPANSTMKSGNAKTVVS